MRALNARIRKKNVQDVTNRSFWWNTALRRDTMWDVRRCVNVQRCSVQNPEASRRIEQVPDHTGLKRDIMCRD